MAMQLKIKDQFFGTKKSENRDAITLRLVSERVTARTIIRERVLAELASRNNGAGLAEESVRADPVAGALNSKVTSRRPSPILDANTEINLAVERFQKNGFIILLDDQQIVSLDEELIATPTSEIVFFHLTPLRGG